MNFGLVTLDALAITISTLFGMGIRYIVDGLWRRDAWPRMWLIGAALSLAYGFILTFVQARVAYEGTRVLMYGGFMAAYLFSSRQLPHNSLGPFDAMILPRFIGGITFTLMFVWIGALLAESISS